MEFFRGENRGNQAGGFGLFAGLSTAPIGPEIICHQNHYKSFGLTLRGDRRFRNSRRPVAD
jgi:hypothetical protein